MKYFCDRKRHLVCVPYSVANLHRMAADLNINRCWFHSGNKPHYDIPSRRINEVTNNANVTVVDSRQILKIIKSNG